MGGFTSRFFMQCHRITFLFVSRCLRLIFADSTNDAAAIRGGVHRITFLLVSRCLRLIFADSTNDAAATRCRPLGDNTQLLGLAL